MKNFIDMSTNPPSGLKKKEAVERLMDMHKRLYSLQNLFYAEKKHAMLIILQGMDTSGKDGTIRHVFSCINPQGCYVKSFKTPTEEERLHDFLWRISKNLPEKGMIGIFNRSQYEDILFPFVHKTLNEKEFEQRHKEINGFEEHLQDENTIILKFFLHISKKEQARRIKQRLTIPEKKWKYSSSDKKEGKKWADYMDAYQNVIEGCLKHNPWIVVPSDKKWYRNYLVASVIVESLEKLKMQYPDLSNIQDK